MIGPVCGLARRINRKREIFAESYMKRGAALSEKGPRHFGQELK